MRWAAAIAGALAFVLIVGALLAPALGERAANRVLATVPGYGGAIAALDIGWLSGSAVVHGLVLERPGIAEPFVAVERLEIRPHVGAWLRGKRIVDVAIDGLAIHYVVGRDAARSQTELDARWIRSQLTRFPVTVDRVVVRDAQFRYRDDAASPDVDLEIRALGVEAENFANLARAPDPLFGRIRVQGVVEGDGRLAASARVDPYARAPRFVADATVDGLPLTKINDALRAYLRVDAEGGTFSVDTDLEGRDGSFSGRAEPRLAGVALRKDRDREPPLRALWESVVGLAEKVGEAVTPGKDAVEVGVPVRGTFGDEPAVLTVVRALPRAWLGALARALDVGAEAAGEAAKGATEAGKAVRSERAD